MRSFFETIQRRYNRLKSSAGTQTPLLTGGSRGLSTTKGPREAVTPYSVKVLMLVEAGVILFLTYWLMSEYTHNIFFRSYADQILLDPMTGYVALLVMGVGLTASTAVRSEEHTSELQSHHD